jgi:hypothetical protein
MMDIGEFRSNVKVLVMKSKELNGGMFKFVTVIGSFYPSKKYGNVMVLIMLGCMPMSDSGE